MKLDLVYIRYYINLYPQLEAIDMESNVLIVSHGRILLYVILTNTCT